MSNQVEALLEFHNTRSFGTRENMLSRQQEARALYASLSPGEQAELVEAVLAGTGDAARWIETVLCCLACFQPGSLTSFHEELVQRRILYPGVIFHGARDETAHRLLSLVEDDRQRNPALVALAWVGNETVQRAFAGWRDQPPPWASALHVPSHRYAHEAGWELTPGGTRRDLFQERAFRLVRATSAPACVGGVRVGVAGDTDCQWCGRRLTALFAFDDVGEVLPRPGSGPVLVLTCDACTCYGVVFARHDRTGRTVWHEANAEPEYLPSDTSDWAPFPDSPLALSGETRHFLEAANWSMLPGVTFSQVGGLPTWINDADFPSCPDCSRTMLFLGQISNEDVREGEGIYYAFHCVPCHVTATTYQQS